MRRKRIFRKKVIMNCSKAFPLQVTAKKLHLNVLNEKKTVFNKRDAAGFKFMQRIYWWGNGYGKQHQPL